MRLNPDFFEDPDKDFNPEDNAKLIKHLSDLPKEVAELMEKQRDAAEEMVADLQESSALSEEQAWQEIAIFQGLQLTMLQKAVVGLQKAVLELSKGLNE
jgi:vacuolar-type H+-ATPase subunit D/Vma8